MKKRKKGPRRRVARNILIPIEREDGTYDMTQEALGNLMALIMAKNDELVSTHELLQSIGLTTSDVKRQAQRESNRAYQYFEDGRKSWLDRNFRSAMRLFSDAFEDLRKAVNKLHKHGNKEQYILPNIYHIKQLTELPTPTREEIHTLGNLARLKAKVWQHYYIYLKNIGFEFGEWADWYYRGVVNEAFNILNNAIQMYQQQADLDLLRGEFLSAICFIHELTDHLWQFSDPRGKGRELLNWTWAAYYDYMQEQMRNRQPIGSFEEMHKAVADISRARGYLEPGAEPPPPPPQNLERFEFLR